MTTYLFSEIDNNDTLVFDPYTDQLVFDSTDLSAADFRLTALPDDGGLSWSGGGKTFTLAGTTLDAISVDNVLFADGSALVTSGEANGFATDLHGTDHDDLLIGGPIGQLHRVSENATQVPADRGALDPSTSADGRLVAFTSDSANFGINDTNGISDIYLKNLETGFITRVSTKSNGGEATSDYLGSSAASISSDGSSVVFESWANNLVANDTNGTSDIFRKDLVTGTTTLVSASSSGTQANGDSYGASVSHDGRHVAFFSYANNLVAGDTNGAADVFVKDTLTGQVTLASASAAGVQGNASGPYNGSHSPSLSANGQYVLFLSHSTNLVASDTNASPDLFVKNVLTGDISCVTTDINGAFVSGGYPIGSLSADGRHAAFYSAAELMHDGQDGEGAVYVRNLDTGELQRVAGAGGAVMGNVGRGPALSADGRFVVFTSTQALVQGDTNGNEDIYVKDMLTGAVARVSVGAAGEQATYGSLQADISDDGKTIVFISDNAALLGGPTNALKQTFVVDNPLSGWTLQGGLGNDVYQISRPDLIIEAANGGFDTVESSGNYVMADHIERLVLTGANSIDGRGNAQANSIVGNSATNRIEGGAGDDTLDGGAGVDTAEYTNATAGVTVRLTTTNPQNTGGAGTDSLRNFENLGGSAYADNLTGSSGANLLDGRGGADTLTGGAGNDTYVVDNIGDRVIETAGGGTDLVRSTISTQLQSQVENLTLLGSADLAATGNELNNTLVGNVGANLLDGGQGADTMVGGFGDDTYLVDNAGDVIIEDGFHVDEVQASVSWTLVEGLENLTLTGSGAINGTGNTWNNLIIGNDAANVLDGGGGTSDADTLIGGLGDDTYVVDFFLDETVESAGGGVDTVLAFDSWLLQAETENLTLVGDQHIGGIGNEKANLLTGNSGDNRLNGRDGTDTLVGGTGNDTYVIEGADGDSVVEEVDGGYDSIESAISLTLVANVEHLRLTGTAAIDGYGNALDNMLVGNAAANLLDGGEGSDHMQGGAGNDVYRVQQSGDSVLEEANAGIDRVESSLSYTLGVNVENLTLIANAAVSGTGNGLANRIVGNAAANTLDGAAGVDTLTGGGGNDVYVVDQSADQVVELAGEGHDLVRASASFVLSAEVEDLTLTGSQAIQGTGNGLANHLLGNGVANALTGQAGDDTLDGAGGADTLTGGTGDDRYVVDHTGDQVVELAGEGRDLIQAAVSWALSANVEDLTLTGTASNATGNSLANTIVGNASNNRLDGGAGADSMTGGAGDDVYVVDNLGDRTNELGGEGNDSVQASIDWTLGAELENLTLTGSAVSASGNSLANVMVGNGLNNTLNGGAGDDSLNGSLGADTLTGGLGNDTYTIDQSSDVVVELAGGGADTVISWVSTTLSAEVENLTLAGSGSNQGIGNTLNNALTGNSGSNYLNGGLGNDTMTGGAGNDTYVVDNSADRVVEAVGGGTDSVQSFVSWTLGAEVENLILAGSGSTQGIGNTLSNTLTGNSGNNYLNGGLGNDTMTGGAGNDTYVVDNAADRVIEATGGGTDAVQSFVSWTLGTEVENLTLLGSSSIQGVGNTLHNAITGNGGNNYLNGGVGNDTMTGGAGNDTYVVDSSADLVVETGGSGIDSVQSFVSWTLGTEVENLTLAGSGANQAIGNTLNNTLTGNSGSNVINGGAGADTLTGGAGNDTFDFTSALTSDVITDFLSGTDKIRLSQATIRVGDGDTVIEGAVAVSGPNGFAASAELVIVGQDIADAITADSAASAIGRANSAYTVGDARLFVVDNGTDSAVYLFRSVNADAIVTANELTLVAALDNTQSTTATDYLFGP